MMLTHGRLDHRETSSGSKARRKSKYFCGTQVKMDILYAYKVADRWNEFYRDLWKQKY